MDLRTYFIDQLVSSIKEEMLQQSSRYHLPDEYVMDKIDILAGKLAKMAMEEDYDGEEAD